MPIIAVITFRFAKIKFRYIEVTPRGEGVSHYDEGLPYISRHLESFPVKTVLSLCAALALLFTTGCTPEAPTDVDTSTDTTSEEVSETTSNTTTSAETPSSNVTGGGETPTETP